MFKKIFKFLKGYVIIEIVGKNRERFVNMCLDYGIVPQNCNPKGDGIVMDMAIGDFKCIRPLVRQCRVRVTILKKCGLGIYIREHKKRAGFLVAGVIATMFVIISNQYIWCVEITGIKQTDKAVVTELLQKNGVYVGARKDKIADLRELKNSIIYGVDTINWAWLYMEGSKAELQVQEAVMPPEVVDKVTATDIIAIADGYVREATIKRGERRVNKGMNVTKGEVLISGKVPVFVEGTEERYDYVNAHGTIVADTIRQDTARFSKKEILRVPTGNKKTRWCLELFGKAYRGDYDKYYENYHTEEERYDLSLPFIGYTGISLGKDTIYEVREVTDYLMPEEILFRAKEKLEERIMKGVGVGARKLDDALTYTIEDDTYLVTLKMYLRENIGMEIPRER